MNKDRILELADHIEKSETYDQRTWFHTCGTPACIAGHAAMLFAADKLLQMGHMKCPDIAQNELGLSWIKSQRLFDGSPLGFTEDEGFIKVSSAHAVKVLRHLAETGEVDWSII